ncbi:MAG: hypothetical protein NWE93_11295 [Candidatus Bathyarchaeota archaeon]|nr:hypothetical protein [Candidatus Bathyarchaeota archaeon]
MKVDKQNLKQKSPALMNYLECELNESQSLEEFKQKFADVKAIFEASNAASNETAQADKIDFIEYDRILVSNVCEKTQQIMDAVEALNDFWLNLMQGFVVREGSEEVGRPLLNEEKQALVELLTTGSS